MKTKISLLVLFISISVFAQKAIYFPSFEGINVNSKHIYVATKLFKKYTDSNGTYKIILPDGFNEQTPYVLENIKENALKKRASAYILSDMTAIGNLLIINMKMYRTATGELIWSDALKLDTIEDLDIVLRLFAKSIGSKEPASKNADIYSVTTYESKELNRREANSGWGASIIGGLMYGGGFYSNAGFGFLYSADNRKLIFDIKAEFLFSKSANNIRIGGNIIKPLNNKDSSPFIGCGIAYGFTRINDNKNDLYSYPKYGSGLEIEGCFGYIFNRASSSTIRIGAYPFINSYGVKNYSSYSPSNSSNVLGIRFGFTIIF